MKPLKLKGAYWWPKSDEDYHGSSGSSWNKDFSMLCVPKCAVYCMTEGHRPADLIRLITDPFDFMIRYKVRGTDKVFIGKKEMPKTVRYYVSTNGEPMRKTAPPKGNVGDWKRANSIPDETWQKVMSEIPVGAWDSRIHTKNKSKYAEVTTSIESGRLVKCCNKASDFNWQDVDYAYYTEEIQKLMIGESNGR